MKNIVIMGASSGIGLALAELLASRGIKVGLAARHTESMERLRERFPKNVEYSSIDINKEDASEKLLELAGRLGGMDIYVHVSGIGYDNPGLRPEREVQMVSTNAAGFARMVGTAYGYFRDNGRRGQIAAVTSVAGTNGIGKLAAYSASKAFDRIYLTALEQLAHTENVDIAFTDIRPGWIRTPLLKEDEKYPLEMTLDYVVPRVLKAIVRRERVAVIDWRWNLLVGLWRLVPDCLWVRMNIPVS